ncbi:protease [Lithospermum erythrorhizon]|uniref:Protease n=1 Tax=Lithospermum erythrorhizon TaxID=34254 RepID=A0AAV3QC24_LITER
MTTLTIMRALPRENIPMTVDPVVYNMLHEDPGNISYFAVGGLSDQIRELREYIELPLMNPELFIRVGIKPPKGVLLYGPPGTGKTLLARAISSNIDAKFLKLPSCKYIGESARLIRDMFNYARDHQPCIIFMDEIDAIGDGFDQLGKVKMIMATNRPDVLDSALLRPGRSMLLELPSMVRSIMKLLSSLQRVSVELIFVMCALKLAWQQFDYVIHEDFTKAVRKVSEVKKLESSSRYNADFGKDKLFALLKS